MMKQTLHKIGPYSVRHNQVFKGHIPVDKPSLLIHMEGGTCFSSKVGSRYHIGKCFKRYLQAHPELALTINMFEFADSILSADDICTICNAATSEHGAKSLQYLMSEESGRLTEEIMYLQAAGF